VVAGAPGVVVAEGLTAVDGGLSTGGVAGKDALGEVLEVLRVSPGRLADGVLVLLLVLVLVLAPVLLLVLAPVLAVAPVSAPVAPRWPQGWPGRTTSPW